MKGKDDIHNFEKRLKRRIELITTSKNIVEENKKILIEYYHNCIAEGITLARIDKCLFHLYRIACMLGKPFIECNREDITRVVENIERKNYSEWTKHDYKVILKKFFKWLRKTEDYPEEVKWIRTTCRIKNNKLPEEILTEEEVKRIASSADNFRDRAFVLVLYESGCRIGELLPLRIKNIQFDEYGAVLLINGKTGSRRVRIISSSPALAKWLDLHPLRNHPNSFVWIDLRNHGKLLSYNAVCKTLRKLAERAGVKKKVNPHAFRHARATHLASKLTEAQMKELFGWVQSSDMASVYVHLSGRDVDNALLRLHGLAKDKENRDEDMNLRICPRCGERNDPVSNFCKRCASPLDSKAAIQLEERIKMKDKVVARVIETLVKRLNLEKTIYKIIKELKIEKEFEEL